MIIFIEIEMLTRQHFNVAHDVEDLIRLSHAPAVLIAHGDLRLRKSATANMRASLKTLFVASNR